MNVQCLAVWDRHVFKVTRYTQRPCQPPTNYFSAGSRPLFLSYTRHSISHWYTSLFCTAFRECCILLFNPSICWHSAESRFWQSSFPGICLSKYSLKYRRGRSDLLWQVRIFIHSSLKPGDWAADGQLATHKRDDNTEALLLRPRLSAKST